MKRYKKNIFFFAILLFPIFALAGPVAPIVTTEDATSISSSTATLNGVVNPQSSAGQAWFIYGDCPDLNTSNSLNCNNSGPGTSRILTNFESIPSDATDHTLSVTVTDLRPNTAYQFLLLASYSSTPLVVAKGSLLSFTTQVVPDVAPITSSPSTTPSPTSPSSSFTGSQLVPCDGGILHPCNFDAFMELVNRVIKFLLFDLSIPFAAILFAYAGFLLLTSGGSEEKRRTAKSIFVNVFFGLVIALAAWLVVETIIHALGYDGTWIGF